MAITYTTGPWSETDGAIDMEAGTYGVKLPQADALPPSWSVSVLFSLVAEDDDPTTPVVIDAAANLLQVAGGTKALAIGPYRLVLNPTPDDYILEFRYSVGTYTSTVQFSSGETRSGFAGTDGRRWHLLTAVADSVSYPGSVVFSFHLDDAVGGVEPYGIAAGTPQGSGGVFVGGDSAETDYISSRVAATWVWGRALTAAEHLAAFADLRDNGTDASILPPED